MAVSGITAVLHARARKRRRLAVFGALTGISALAALFPGHPAGPDDAAALVRGLRPDLT